jgi:hypothetical protein
LIRLDTGFAQNTTVLYDKGAEISSQEDGCTFGKSRAGRPS